jgi:citrate lyase subunit gamma (acyl carrier protein)
MQILKAAMAGTLESSDVQVTLEPHEGENQVEVQSSVLAQYGRQIKDCVNDTLSSLDVNGVKVTVVDKGALECTIKARVQCAAYRAAGVESGYPWGGAIK